MRTLPARISPAPSRASPRSPARRARRRAGGARRRPGAADQTIFSRRDRMPSRIEGIRTSLRGRSAAPRKRCCADVKPHSSLSCPGAPCSTNRSPTPIRRNRLGMLVVLLEKLHHGAAEPPRQEVLLHGDDPPIRWTSRQEEVGVERLYEPGVDHRRGNALHPQLLRRLEARRYG